MSWNFFGERFFKLPPDADVDVDWAIQMITSLPPTRLRTALINSSVGRGAISLLRGDECPLYGQAVLFMAPVLFWRCLMEGQPKLCELLLEACPDTEILILAPFEYEVFDVTILQGTRQRFQISGRGDQA